MGVLHKHQPIAEDKYSIIIPSLAKSVFQERNLLTVGPSGLPSRNIMQANRVLRHVSGMKNLAIDTGMSGRVAARDTGLYTCSISQSLGKELWTGSQTVQGWNPERSLHTLSGISQRPSYQSVGWRCASHYTAFISIKWDNQRTCLILCM